MKLNSAEPLDLCYCTNIHPGEGWEAVNANIRRFAPALRARFAPAEKFGIGLRLSASEARGLLRGGRLEEFRSFLNAEGLYVALINGFPYGPFHGTAVKADVYAPDWREEARVQYTLDLAEVLKELLPEGLEGGISTSPLSYKRWLKAPRNVDWETMTLNLARVAEALVQIRRDTGQFIHLDIEPEPDCLIENSGELIWFFEGWLLPAGGSYLAKKLGVAKSEARRHLLDHIQTCFDCCHFAVEYEDPADALARIARTGIKVGRVQLSSALEVMLPDDPAQRARVGARLAPFAESTYLHQVIEKRGDCLHHFSDLGEALSEAAEHGASQWRIHFHVPLFTREYDGFCSTQSYVRKVLEIAISTPFTRRLEIETYTWDVLPSELKLDLLDSIGREYEWVLSQIGAARGAAG